MRYLHLILYLTIINNLSAMHTDDKPIETKEEYQIAMARVEKKLKLLQSGFEEFLLVIGQYYLLPY